MFNPTGKQGELDINQALITVAALHCVKVPNIHKYAQHCIKQLIWFCNQCCLYRVKRIQITRRLNHCRVFRVSVFGKGGMGKGREGDQTWANRERDREKQSLSRELWFYWNNPAQKQSFNFSVKCHSYNSLFHDYCQLTSQSRACANGKLK